MGDDTGHQKWVSATEFLTAEPSDSLVVQKFAVGAIVPKGDGDEGSDESHHVSFIISTDGVDRDNDTIAVDGWELGAYKENPVVLWAHSRSDLPVGRAVEIGVKDGKLVAEVEFAGTPDAQQVHDLVDGGFINAASVGFRPLEYVVNEERGGVDFQRQELVEFSIVPVPSNPEALIAASAEGVSLEVLRGWVGDVIGAWPGEMRLTGKAWDKLKADGAEPLVLVPDDGGAVGAPLLSVSKDMAAEGDEAPGDESMLLSAFDEQVLARISGVEARIVSMQHSLGRVVGGLSQAAGSGAHKGAATETVRWNKQLPESFDITEQEFTPRSVEQAMASKYCGCDVKALRFEQRRVGSVRMGAFLLSLDAELEEKAEVDDIRNLDKCGKEAALLYENIQLNSTSARVFLVDGMRFLKVNDVPMTVRVTPRWYGLDVMSYSAAEDASAARQFMADVLECAARMRLLKGEAFALSGEFLDRGDVTFDDVFLADENAGALRRTATLVNENAEALENRGMLLIGPPGVGKTMSGRALMNEAEATFIWISARDFYYGGGFQTLDDAFELARENAPTVLFIEDVDSYLSGDVVDLLKTAMDGLAQSTGIVTVLTSNYPERLPAAIIDRPGRFHDVLRFDLPTEALRGEMLARWLPDLVGDALVHVVDQMSGYSGAHVREFARFVGVLQEQDGLDVQSASLAALGKIQEQRDLITSVQSEGSHFRAPSHVLVAVGGECASGSDVVLVIKEEDGDEIVLQLQDEEEAGEGGDADETIHVDLLDLREAVEDASRRAFVKAVGTHTESAVRYHRGRV